MRALHLAWVGLATGCVIDPSADLDRLGAEAPVRQISDLVASDATNGWGPIELDRSNGELAGFDGGALRLDGAAFDRGLGVHAPARLRYDMGGGCSRLTARIGVDDEVGSGGSVVFQVVGDGAILYNSGVVTGDSPTATVDVAIDGVDQLALIVADAGDGIVADHADWADARVACATAPPASVPFPLDSVVVAPGDDIQAVVEAHPAGSTFLLQAGIHRRQSITPRTGDRFLGEPGTILDGEDATAYAFQTSVPPPDDVAIRGLTIERYVPEPQMGAIRAGGHFAPEQTHGWSIDSCEIRYNATGGIRLGHGTRVTRSFIHHNRQIGIVGGGDDIVIDGNEIAHNNDLDWFDPGWEAGGTKFVGTRRLVVRGNYSHHNRGPGLWTDIDNVDSLYEYNLVEDNLQMGIFHEISRAATIRYNTARRNGPFGTEWWIYGAGIMVAASPDVEIYGNSVSDNFNGITAIQQERGDGAYGRHELRNLNVHDNFIAMTTGLTGVAQDVSEPEVFTDRGIRFEHNVYALGPERYYFAWMDGNRSQDEWRAFGLD